MSAPAPGSPQELQFRLAVDDAHCDRAAQGLRLMAQYQYRTLALRYQNAAWIRRLQRGGSKVAPAIAVVALVAGLLTGWAAFPDTPQRRVYAVLSAILLLEAAALWWLPRRVDGIGVALRVRFERKFGDRAAAMMRKTRRALPFEAVYDLRGDLLAYARVADGRWTQRWHRHLDKFRPRGVALQAPGLLAIFRTSSTVFPSLIVLTGDDGAMAAAWRARGWTITDVAQEPSEPPRPPA